MKLRAMVVDDELPARRRLTELLARDGTFELAAACGDGRQAIEAIVTDRPDLVVLDVQMPEVTGFDVVRALGPDRMPPVIFATAYDRYATRAFEVAAIDYLLKPFEDARLFQALARAREQIRLRTADELRAQLVHLLATAGEPAPSAGRASFLERIAVRDRREIRILAVADIEYITASGPYAEIHVGREALLHRERMAALEDLLDPARFCRVHRSTIVNLAHVVALEPKPTGDSVLRLRAGQVLQVSRSRLAELHARLGVT